jgi:hypothetical protein
VGLGRRLAPAVIEEPEPYQPDLLLLVDAATGFVFGSEVLGPTLHTRLSRPGRRKRLEQA